MKSIALAVFMVKTTFKTVQFGLGLQSEDDKMRTKVKKNV